MSWRVLVLFGVVTTGRRNTWWFIAGCGLPRASARWPCSPFRYSRRWVRETWRDTRRARSSGRNVHGSLARGGLRGISRGPVAADTGTDRTSAAYQWLRSQPDGVVAEFPMPTIDTMPLQEARFQFLSTFHWRPIVNGYSGNWSLRQVRFLHRVRGFPDESAIRALRAAGVRYLFVHERHFGRGRYRDVIAQVETCDQVERAGRFDDGGFETAVYRLRS